MNSIEIVKRNYSQIDKHLDSMIMDTKGYICIDVMEETFIILREIVLNEILSFKPHYKENESHQKIVFYEKEIGDYILKYEAIFFRKDYSTGAHTHAQFMVDEIIKGKLQENKLTPYGSNKYSYGGILIRKENDRRKIHCKHGHPHNVMSIHEACISICLSFGNQRIEAIAEDNIKVDH